MAIKSASGWNVIPSVALKAIHSGRRREVVQDGRLEGQVLDLQDRGDSANGHR